MNHKSPLHIKIREGAGKLLFPAIIDAGGNEIQVGGIADLPRNAYMHQIAKSFRDPRLRRKRTMRVTNTGNRCLFVFKFPKTGLRTIKDGVLPYVTPCEGAFEGVLPVRENWQGTYRADLAINLAKALETWNANPTLATEQIVIDSLVMANAYPNWLTEAEQNEGLDPNDPRRVTIPTPEGSQARMRRASTTTDENLMRELAEQIGGLRHFVKFAGERRGF